MASTLSLRWNIRVVNSLNISISLNTSLNSHMRLGYHSTLSVHFSLSTNRATMAYPCANFKALGDSVR
ncbi:MAG: hypothetical protein NVSMB4_12570 [Acidimicrobiales bacterium]